MGFKLSAMKGFKQPSHVPKLKYLSSWSIWHSQYSLGFLAPSRKKEKRVKQVQGTGNDQVVEVRLRASTYEGTCSALLHLYYDSEKNKEAASP